MNPLGFGRGLLNTVIESLILNKINPQQLYLDKEIPSGLSIGAFVITVNL